MLAPASHPAPDDPPAGPRPRCELDITNLPALSKQWLGIVVECTPDCFIIDLAKVTFLDSTGLGALIGSYRPIEPDSSADSNGAA